MMEETDSRHRGDQGAGGAVKEGYREMLHVQNTLMKFADTRRAMAAQPDLGRNGDAVMARLWKTHLDSGTIYTLGLDKIAAVLASHVQEEFGARYTAGAKKNPPRKDREALRSNDISGIVSEYPVEQTAARIAGYCTNSADTLLVYSTAPLKGDLQGQLLRGIEAIRSLGVHVSVTAPQGEQSLLAAADTPFSIPTHDPRIAAGIIENLLHAQCEGAEVEWRDRSPGDPDRSGLFASMLLDTAGVEEECALGKDETFLKSIIETREALLDRLGKGGTLYVAGNGGSACDAIQFANLVAEGPLPSGRFPKIDRNALAPGYNTCCTNDGFDPFPRLVESVSDRNDIFAGYTTSGKSANVLKSIRDISRKGALTVAFTGYGGLQYEGVEGGTPAAREIHVPFNETGLVQVVHWTAACAVVNWHHEFRAV